MQMDLKRSRDLDDDDSSPFGKRTRLEAQAAALATSSNAMQAVAHEALAMTNGSSFSAINAVASGPPNSYVAADGDIGERGERDGRGDHGGQDISTGHGYAPFQSMSDITRCFQNAVQKSWDRRSPTYANVDVMIVFWSEDDSDVKDAAAHLASVFRTRYHFATDIFAIQSSGAGDDLYERVNLFFTKRSSPGDLAILYYAGQIVANRQVGEAPVWTPRRKNPDATIESRPIQAAYENASCDVLLLFDFCTAYHYPLTKASYGTARRNVIEVLDAPSFDPESGYMSFTRALTEELDAVASEGPIPVETLHTQISDRMTVAKPRSRGRGRPPKDPPGRAVSDQLHLPKHYWLFRRRSIVLAPQPDEPQVLLCLRLLDGSLSINQWAKWIYNTTPKARNSVRIEGIYCGFSTMIVLRVPVSEWSSFSASPAGSFVGYSTIGDIDQGTLERIDEDLASKLWLGDVSSRIFYPSTTFPGASMGMVITSPPVSTPAALPSSAHPDPATPSHAAAAGSDLQAGLAEGEGDAGGAYSLRASQKRARKALPTERKILPSESPMSARKKEYMSSGDRSPLKSSGFQHQSQQMTQRGHRQSIDMGDVTEKNALLAAAAQKPFKISIKLAGQTHICKECKAGFKDADSLQNHVRKQHTRPFHCVFNWAGCESTFASKNEWKRHVMSQHILLQYWVCQVELCSKVVNKVTPAGASSSSNNNNSTSTSTSNNNNNNNNNASNGASAGFSLPNGAIFNRKDLFTQHLRRMHTPPHVKKLMKQAKQGAKTPNHPAILEWENRLKELQQDGLKPRCRLPDYMICPAQGCGIDFHGNNAWDDRMEHVARHLEAAAAGREPPVIFGGNTDTTLTNWATRPEVGIAKRVGPNTWHLDNPLRPEIMAWTEDDTDPQHGVRQDVRREADLVSSRERSRSVIEVADADALHSSRGARDRDDADGPVGREKGSSGIAVV